MTVWLFGKISEARVGVYGDFNEIYHRSLLEPGIRNLIWKLGPPNGFSDQFHKQSEALEKIENLLDAHMEPSQRAAKFTAQIELKRKIAKKIDSTTAIIPPDEEKDFWKK
jgi:hypothetical protein